jgi:hypothetical protein
MKYLVFIVLMVILFFPTNDVAYSTNVITGLTLHGVVQKLTPETGNDSLTVRDDSVWIVIDDSTRISFIAGYSPGSARLQGGVNKVIELAYDSVFVDVDTNSATPIIIFGGFGGAIRWNRATDKMQFSNDLSAWSDIGTSSGMAATDFADSLDAANYLDSTNIANQGIVPDDIDTTDNDFVFFDAFKGTSATDDSTYMTKKWITDQTTGMPPADFNDSLESQVEFSPKLYDKIDTTSAVIPKADSTSASFNPLYLSGGFWRDRLTFVVRADNGTCYLVVDNKYTASQDVDVWLSSDGSGGRDGGTVEMYLWAMPDSIALTAGTATTLEENFVYLTYNGESPALKRHAAEDQKKETGGMIDSMAFVASIGLGAVSGDDEQVRSFITNQPSLYKDVMRSAFHTAPQHHEGITPTVESHSFSATRGFMQNGRNYELIPSVNTDDVYLYVPVYNDSNYAQWDSLDNFAEYANGDAISVPHYFWVVIWGAISEDTTQYKLYMNIQTGTNTYLTRETAEQDKYNMLPTDIPAAYHETGFLIAGIIINNDEVQALEDGSTYLDLRGQISGTRGGGGAPPTDSAQVNSWNFVLPPEIHDSLDANWGTFTAGTATVKWRDSSYVYLDTANILGGNTEIKAWLDTTAVRVPIADSTHGGATQATTCKTADSTDGGAIRAETCKLADSTGGGAIRAETTKLADSTDGGATRAESAQGLVGKSVNSTDPADGEVLTYYTTGDTLGWTGAGAGDVTDVIGGAGLVDDGNTGAITVDLQIGSWPLDLNADSVWLDSTEIVNWNLWTEAYDSIDNWNNLINADFVYNDGDTTTGTYVFANVFRGASAVVESTYVTLETIEDTAALCGRVAGQVWTGTHDFGGGVFEITNGANPTTDAEGEMAWDANDDALEVYSGDESESVLIPMYQKIDALIFAPDGVNDVITLLKVDALLYPHGIEIDQLSFTLPADAAYDIGFHEWTGADPPIFSAQIDSLVTTASDAYIEDGTPTDGAIAADATIRANIRSTDVDWVHIQIIFHVVAGN